MHRRRFLTATTAGLGSLAGCSGILETRQVDDGGSAGDTDEPSVLQNRPDAVYVPTHFEGMAMAGMAKQGDYKCALGFSVPHRFWLVTGTRTEQVELQSADTMHLMPLVWDGETGVVPADTNPQITVRRDGERVTQLSPWPMLSQRMGFHFGDNVQLPAEGTYQVEVSVSGPSTTRTGSLADKEHGPATFDFELEATRANLQDIMYRDIPEEKEGTRGAVEPMDMEMMPSTAVPTADQLPGTVRGEQSSGDATFVVASRSDVSRFGGSSDETYLAVSPRTPYNRYMLPLMSLSATLTRGDETIYDDVLKPALDPDLDHHYGAAVSGVESGDELTITVDAPPQVSRHEGYETAFLGMPEMQLTL